MTFSGGLDFRDELDLRERLEFCENLPFSGAVPDLRGDVLDVEWNLLEFRREQSQRIFR